MQEDRIVGKIEGLDNPIWLGLFHHVGKHLMTIITKIPFEDMYRAIYDQMELRPFFLVTDPLSGKITYPKPKYKGKVDKHNYYTCNWSNFTAYRGAKPALFKSLRETVISIMLTSRSNYEWMKKYFDWYQIYRLGEVSFFQNQIQQFVLTNSPCLRMDQIRFYNNIHGIRLKSDREELLNPSPKKMLFGVTKRKIPICLLGKQATIEKEHNHWVRIIFLRYYFYTN